MSDNKDGRSDDQMKCVYMGPPMKKNLFASLREKFFGKGPGKKAPYPKSFADDPDPEDDPGTVDVYARPPAEEEPELEEVYMGPPVTEEAAEEDVSPPEDVPQPPVPEDVPELPVPEDVPELPAEEKLQNAERKGWRADPGTIEGVYAGPQIPPMAPVYAGPEMMSDQGRFNLVYGGPSMMSGPKKDADRSNKKSPRMEALYAAPRRPQPSEMMMVYAGPDFFSNNRNAQTPMMMAYAGPQMNIMQMSMDEQMKAAQEAAEKKAQEAAQQSPAEAEFCPNCGAQITHQGIYCSECGSPLPGRTMTCPCCGSIVKKAVFCSECGFAFPKEETESDPKA